jgi:hypothetical protein
MGSMFVEYVRSHSRALVMEMEIMIEGGLR